MSHFVILCRSAKTCHKRAVVPLIVAERWAMLRAWKLLPRASLFAPAGRRASLGPLDYVATVVLLAVFVIGTSMDEGPDTSIDFYRAVATVIPTLLITVAIQGRVFELSRKVTFRHQYR